MNLTRVVSVPAALFLGASSAGAAVAYQQPSWGRPTSAAQASAELTTYQHWDAFTSTSANLRPAPTPSTDPLAVNPNGPANAFDANHATSGATVTSTGNLYAGSGIIRMNTVVPSYNRPDAVVTKFLLQITTTANALFDTDGLWVASTPDNPVETDFSRLLVNGQRVDSLPSFDYERLFFTRGSSATSFNVERAISFELPGNAASYTIEWTAARGSTSMAEIAVDTQTLVPEPAAVGLVAVAAGVAALRRRRRRA
jgi:hypothetical protein